MAVQFCIRCSGTLKKQKKQYPLVFFDKIIFEIFFSIFQRRLFFDFDFFDRDLDRELRRDFRSLERFRDRDRRRCRREELDPSRLLERFLREERLLSRDLKH